MNLSKQKPLNFFKFFFLVFLFLHTHTRVCMFLVNLLQCSGHSLSGPWGCESLVKSVVMKPPMRKPRGQISLCALPRPHIWAQWERSLYKFCRKGSRLWWALWVPGHSLFLPVSLFLLMGWCQWVFWEPSPIRKDSRTFPGGSQGNCPPSSETVLSPTAQGVLLSTSPRKLPAGEEDLLFSCSGFIGVFRWVIFTYSTQM